MLYKNKREASLTGNFPRITSNTLLILRETMLVFTGPLRGKGTSTAQTEQCATYV